MLLLLLVSCVFQFGAKADIQGWAGWSPWTPCSRTCGGGMSQQLRRCLDVKCSGISVRQRVCNSMECDKPSRTARDTVCGGETILSKQQCEVVCRSASSGAKFIWRVADGTPCQGTTHRSVCSSGVCQAVGCDDVIGSSLRMDGCGICGGRGDTCETSHFDWRDSGEFSPCPQDCQQAAKLAQLHGGAYDTEYQVSVFVCVNRDSGRVVPERMCADRGKPTPTRRECPLLICPSRCRWVSSDWSECVPGCGSGLRQRTVYCVQALAGNTSINVPDKYCPAQMKPPGSESCVSKWCGTWDTGPWTSCSASCGTGTRSRVVTCVGGTDCDKVKKPQVHQSCYAGIPCNVIPPQALQAADNPAGPTEQPGSLDWPERRLLDGQSWSGQDAAGAATPRIVTGAWGSCSASCGPGVSSRKAECVALHPMTRNIIQLPDSECSALPQPPLFQPCEERPCPLQEEPKDAKDNSPYRWEHGEYGQCSASCLGGKQKAVLMCVEVATNRPVSWSHCDARRTPPERVKTCNTQPCPATWQAGQFSECTATCGGGTNTRNVRCVRPISKSGGADSNLILPDNQCPHPKPPETQPCAQVACPADWVTGVWSECSSSCGSGEQRRRVECEGRDSRGRSERRSERECAAQRPHHVQMCNLGPCGEKPQLKSNRVFEQASDEKKLTLGIGGVATLYQGTSLKIKCPRKNFDKKRIYWTKDGRRIRNDAHIKVSTNGNLRIKHARLEDAGTYECFTDSLQGNVTLHFKYHDEADSVQKALDSNRVESHLHPKHSRLYNITRLQNLLTEISDAEELLKELKPFHSLFKVHYDIGAWSDCKQKACGVHGFQVRDVSCLMVIEGGTTKRTDIAVCSLRPSSKPPNTRPCQMIGCPKWETSEWTECALSRCVRDGVAQQRRILRCLAQNGTEVDVDQCDRSNRPKPKKDCENAKCKAEWRASEWGTCTQSCGNGGVQLRMLQCVWTVSGKAAGRSCEGVRRPAAARPCPQAGQLPTCPAEPPTALPLKDASCEDLSRFCDIIKLFHSCDSEEVRRRCCASCTRYDFRRRT